MDFQDTPLNRTFFAKARPLTVGLLLNNASPALLYEALANGQLEASGAGALNAAGVPALATWAMDQWGNFSHPWKAVVWQPQAWPIDPNGDWQGADLPSDAAPHLFLNQALKAERMAGWFVANAPEGLGHARWTPDSNYTVNGQPVVWPANSMSVVGVAVGLGWERVLDQLLRRNDAPQKPELSGLLSAHSQHVSFPEAGEPNSRSYQHLPLLHCAVEHDRLPVVQRLLAAGLDPNALDGSGTPAMFRVKSQKVLQALLDAGARPDRKATHAVTLVQWWNDHLTAPEAAELLAMTNAWLQTHLSEAELLAHKMPELASDFAQLPLARFKKQLSQLKIPLNIAWEETGEQWTLFRRALALVLQAPPDPSDKQTAWNWGLENKATGEPLLPGTPNTDVLWLVGRHYAPLNGVWEKVAGQDEDGAPSRDPQRLQALMEALAQGPRQTWNAPGTAVSDYHLWLFKLGRVLLQDGCDETSALQAWGRTGTGRFARTTHAEVLRCVDAALERAWQHHGEGNLEGFGRWLGEALVLAGKVPPDTIVPQIMDWRGTQQQIQGFPPGPIAVGTLFNKAVHLRHALGYAQEAGVRLDDGANGQRLENTWQAWENHAAARPVELLAKEVWLNGRLASSNPTVRKPRM